MMVLIAYDLLTRQRIIVIKALESEFDESLTAGLIRAEIISKLSGFAITRRCLCVVASQAMKSSDNFLEGLYIVFVSQPPGLGLPFIPKVQISRVVD